VRAALLLSELPDADRIEVDALARRPFFSFFSFFSFLPSGVSSDDATAFFEGRLDRPSA